MNRLEFYNLLANTNKNIKFLIHTYPYALDFYYDSYVENELLLPKILHEVKNW